MQYIKYSIFWKILSSIPLEMWSIIWKYSIIKNILHRNSSFKKYTINQTNCRICLWISKFYPWVVRHESVIKVAVCLQSDKYAFMVLDCFYAGLQRKIKIMLQMFKMLKNSKLRRKSVFFLIDILDFIKKNTGYYQLNHLPSS